MAKTSKSILDEARSQIKQIDIDEARRMIEKPGPVLIDVREPDEWRQGHISNAVGISRGATNTILAGLAVASPAGRLDHFLESRGGPALACAEGPCPTGL